MHQEPVTQGSDVILNGDDFQIICSDPGVHVTTIDESSHFLDIYLGGTISHYAVEGEASCSGPCPPNSFVFLPAGALRRIKTIRTGVSVRAVFDDHHLQTFTNGGCPDPLPVQRHVFDPAMVGAALIVRDHLSASGAVTGSSEGVTFIAMLAARLAHRLTGRAAPEKVARPKTVQRAILHIEANLDTPLQLTEVADIVGVSPYHFARLFRRTMNMSMHQYIVLRRVEYAERLLLETTDSLADVAYHAGFGSQSHMTTVFRKLRGRTPGEIRSGWTL